MVMVMVGRVLWICGAAGGKPPAKDACSTDEEDDACVEE